MQWKSCLMHKMTWQLLEIYKRLMPLFIVCIHSIVLKPEKVRALLIHADIPAAPSHSLSNLSITVLSIVFKDADLFKRTVH